MPRVSPKKGLALGVALAVMYILGLKSCWVEKKGLMERRPMLHSGYIDRKEDDDLNAETTLKDDKSWLNKMDEKHHARVDALRKACADHYNISLKSVSLLAAKPQRLRSLLVNDEYQFIYSVVYKVGSTNWARVLVTDLGGFKNVPIQKLYNHKGLHWMPRFNSTQIQKRLTKYTSFIFVRNPLSRILSAYRDKFVNHHNDFFTKLGKSIVQKYRDKSVGGLSTDRVTLTEFITYLVDSAAHRSNTHWQPIFHRNLPCEIKYDIIGKLEEASEDIPYVLKRLHIDHLVSYGQEQKKNIAEKDLLTEYFSQVPNDLLQKLLLIYQSDFVLFGYNIPISFTGA